MAFRSISFDIISEYCFARTYHALVYLMFRYSMLESMTVYSSLTWVIHALPFLLLPILNCIPNLCGYRCMQKSCILGHAPSECTPSILSTGCRFDWSMSLSDVHALQLSVVWSTMLDGLYLGTRPSGLGSDWISQSLLTDGYATGIITWSRNPLLLERGFLGTLRSPLVRGWSGYRLRRGIGKIISGGTLILHLPLWPTILDSSRPRLKVHRFSAIYVNPFSLQSALYPCCILHLFCSQIYSHFIPSWTYSWLPCALQRVYSNAQAGSTASSIQHSLLNPILIVLLHLTLESRWHTS